MKTYLFSSTNDVRSITKLLSSPLIRIDLFAGIYFQVFTEPMPFVVINGEDNSFEMLRTAFVDENILAFQLDGTDRYAFMIDENNKALFAPKTLEELNTYLVDKLDKEKQK